MRRLRPRKSLLPQRPAVEVDQFALCVLLVDGGVGTGFCFLKPTWVLTAKHVVVDRHGTRRNLRAMFRSKTVDAELCFAHPVVDLAVLELSEPAGCRAPFLPGDRRLKTGGLIAAGYSPDHSNPEGGVYRQYVSGIPHFDRYTRVRDGLEEVILEFPSPESDGGPSGGPVIGNLGTSVAVVIDGFQKNGVPFMRATSVHSLLEYLTWPGWSRNAP